MEHVFPYTTSVFKTFLLNILISFFGTVTNFLSLIEIAIIQVHFVHYTVINLIAR